MDDRLKDSNNAALKRRSMPSARSLTDVEEDVYQVRNHSGQDPLNFPIKLNNKIAALGSSIEHGDGKPTAASYEVYDVLNNGCAKKQIEASTPAIPEVRSRRA